MKYPSAPNSLKEREQCVIACQTAYSFFNCVLSCKLATRFICLCRHDRLTVLQGENTYQYMEAYHSYSRLRALFAKVIMLTLHLPIKHRGHSWAVLIRGDTVRTECTRPTWSRITFKMQQLIKLALVTDKSKHQTKWSLLPFVQFFSRFVTDKAELFQQTWWHKHTQSLSLSPSLSLSLSLSLTHTHTHTPVHECHQHNRNNTATQKEIRWTLSHASLLLRTACRAESCLTASVRTTTRWARRRPSTTCANSVKASNTATNTTSSTSTSRWVGEICDPNSHETRRGRKCGCLVPSRVHGWLVITQL